MDIKTLKRILRELEQHDLGLTPSEIQLTKEDLIRIYWFKNNDQKSKNINLPCN